MRLIFLCLMFFSNCSFGLSQDFGLYGEQGNYFKLFTSKKLIGDYRERYCQILNFPPFDSPEAVFIVDSLDENHRTIVFRRFNQKQLWVEMAKLASNKNMNYADDYVQAVILNELDHSVLENAKDVPALMVEKLIDSCERILLDYSSPKNEVGEFDGETFFLTNYKAKHGYQTIEVPKSSVESIKNIKMELINLIK